MTLRILLTLAFLATSAVAQAGTLMQMFSTPFSANVGDAAFDVVLPQFDPSLGTLCEVTLELDANTSAGTISWDNEGANPSDIDLGIGAEVTATAPDALALVAVPLQVGSDSVDGDNDGTPDYIGSDSFSVAGGAGNDSDSASLTDPPDDLSAYIGLGNITINIANSVETFVSTSGGFGPIDPNPGVFDGTVKVTYKYSNIVPEPTSIALIAFGCCGLALRRRS